VAIDTGGVTVVVEQGGLGGVVRICGGGKGGDLGAAYSEKTFGAGGEMLEPPLWQAMQSCSFWPGVGGRCL